jgi:peptidoglycan/xylan/chitin deacetylase (PgdA/CDA1 family)
MYHRIADAPVDPWGLAVSPTHFDEQIRVLRRTRHPMPLTDFVRRFMTGTLPANAVALTFDDGYADNLHVGKPRLAAADVPATVFIVVGYLDRPGDFWWDELARLILGGEGPENLRLEIDGRSKHFDLGASRSALPFPRWYAWSGLQTKRQIACMEIWRGLRPLDDGKRGAVMAKLRAGFMRDLPNGAGRPLTRDEVGALVADGLVTIGAHSVTHPGLIDLREVDRRREIVDSKCACEAVVGYQVSAFAYPYGEFDKNVCAAVKAAGFEYACSANSHAVSVDSDIFALPRIQVLDWDGDEFNRRLRV